MRRLEGDVRFVDANVLPLPSLTRRSFKINITTLTPKYIYVLETSDLRRVTITRLMNKHDSTDEKQTFKSETEPETCHNYFPAQVSLSASSPHATPLHTLYLISRPPAL
jgi:hypothetical protein